MKIGDVSGATVTKAGPGSLFPEPDDDDHKEWCACFRAAIGGTLAAQRSIPNPEMVVRLSMQIADRAMDECRKRKRTR